MTDEQELAINQHVAALLTQRFKDFRFYAQSRGNPGALGEKYMIGYNYMGNKKLTIAQLHDSTIAIVEFTEGARRALSAMFHST